MTTSLQAPPPAPTDAQEAADVITVRQLRQYYPIKEGFLQRVTGHVKAVDGVSFSIPRGSTLGLVGESGCGKTTLGRCIADLLEPTGGGVYFRMPSDVGAELDRILGQPEQARSGDDRRRLGGIDATYRIDKMSKQSHREYRRNCQMVFQDAFASLNPRHLIKDIVGRPLRIYGELSGAQLHQRVADLLEQVGMGPQHMYRYPHQFSGGQRQRISIARALALDPELIVLDEPTSALDVSVQAQILNLLHALQKERGLTYLFITHDLNVVRHMSDEIVVMYLGRVAESGSADDIFLTPRHPYTEALLAANPVDDDEDVEPVRLEGNVPDPARPPAGCRFHTRCPVVFEACGWEVDDLVAYLVSSDQWTSAIEEVDRSSRFKATLVMADEEAASWAKTTVEQRRVPAPMLAALEQLRVEGRKVEVQFRPVDDVSLLPVAPGHASACLLHTKEAV